MHATRLEQDLHAGHEVVEVGDVREHVVAEQQVGGRLPGQRPGRLLPEELHQRRDALLERHLGHVGGRLDAEHGDLALVEELQQIAIVGGDLHDVAVAVQAESLDHLLGVGATVLQPARGVRGEVGVVGEDPLGRLELLELHQKAPPADQRAQRVEGLHPVDALRWQVGVRQRRGAEVGEHGFQRRTTESAGSLAHYELAAY